MAYKAKISYNKRTGQPIVFLSKKKLPLLKDKSKKYIRVREEDLF